MAIYHFRVNIISRSTGLSAVGASAYRAGEKIHNEYDGVTHDYTRRRSAVASAAYRSGDKLQLDKKIHDFTRKQDIIHSEIMLPKHAPREYFDRSVLWNAVEKSENRKDSQTAREIVVALPNELSFEQNKKLLRDYVQRNFVDKGMCADINYHAGHIHDRKGEKYPFEGLAIRKDNPHAHIQLTMRPINRDGSWGAKSKKEYILDRNGERIRLKSGKGWRSRRIDTTDWDKTATLEKWREDWERTVNTKFERLGIDERISHKSLKAQGIDREPTVPMGFDAWDMEKQGIRTRQGDKNRAIVARNKAKQRQSEKPPERENTDTAIITQNKAKEQQPEKIHEIPETPEQVAERIHELKQEHFNLDRECSELQQQTSVTQREIRALQAKMEDIGERAEHIQSMEKKYQEKLAKRQSMGVFTSKKDIDRQTQMLEHSLNQAKEYFKRKYEINPEFAKTEIRQLEKTAKRKLQLQEQTQEELKALTAKRDMTVIAYQKDMLLSECRYDCQKLYDRIAVLENQSRPHERSPRYTMALAKSQRALDNVSEQNFMEILKTVTPKQAQVLKELWEREAVRRLERIRSYGRGR